MDLCGGFGRFQKISATMLILAMVLSQCFLYSFPFLENTPKYLCRYPPISEKTPWVQCGAADFCDYPEVERMYNFDDSETIENMIT
jgi:hypothetical protein